MAGTAHGGWLLLGGLPLRGFGGVVLMCRSLFGAWALGL